MNIYQKILFLIFFVMSSDFLYSQNTSEFATWSSFKIKHKISKELELNGTIEYRSKENLSISDRWGMNLGVKYSFTSYLQGEAAYEIHYKNYGNDKWDFRNRYNIGLEGKLKSNHWKLSLRERLQQTFYKKEETENRLRSRIKIAYEPDDWILTPYFSVEIYQPIGNEAFFKISRVRYRPGININITDKLEIDLFYCRQYESDKKQNIIGIELTYNL